MSKTKHRNGNKFKGSHTTVVGEFTKLLKSLHKTSTVSKIVTGRIVNDRKGAGSPLRIKCILIPSSNCIRITAIKGGVSQQFFVYINNVEHLEEVAEIAYSFTDKQTGKRGKKVRNKRKNTYTPQNNVFF